MTFTELMQMVTHDQQVRLHILESNDTITGMAETLDNYVCVELAGAEVVEINAEKGVLNVWVKE